MRFRCASMAACIALVASCHRTADPEPLQIAVTNEPGAGIAPVSLTAADGTGLILRELQAKVVLDPPLAFTQLEFAFQNPQPARLEGRFEIALPEGASISRLALQFSDHYEEGEVVARRKAVAAYEEAVHGRRDPALLEHDAGNEYRLRVFPIEAHETKHVVVAYSQIIDGAYRLPLAGLPRIDHLHVEIGRAAEKPVAPQVFERRTWQPSGNLVARIPEGGEDRAIVSGDLVLLHAHPATECRAAALDRLTLLIDTSASAATGFELRMRRLRALLSELNAQRGAPFPLQIVVFDQEFVPLIETRSDQLGPELETQLRARAALGATDLEAALTGAAQLPSLGDRVVLYSDGIATAGASDHATLARAAAALAGHGVQRLDAITYGETVDRAMLAALVYADLPEAGVIAPDSDAGAAARRLLRGTERSVDVQVEGADWTYPQTLSGVEADRAYPIFAKLHDPHRLELNAGSQRVILHATKASASALFEHEWARARIDYLEHKLDGLAEPDATPVRDMLVDLSVRHHVLSDATAWVVLQGQADYDRHAIARSSAPPLQVSNGVLSATPGNQAVGGAAVDEPWLHEPQYGARESAPARADSAAAGIIGIIGNGKLGASGQSFGIEGLGISAAGRGGGASAGTHVHQYRDDLVRVMHADVRGSLSKEVIRRIIQRHINEAKFCYEQALANTPWLQGHVIVKFVVAPTGQVQAALERSEPGNTATAECLLQAVRRWTFPSPEDGGIVVVTQGFELRPPGHPFKDDWDGGADRKLLAAIERSRAEQARREERAAQRAERAARRAERAAQREAHDRREREWLDRPHPVAADSLDGPLREVAALIEAGEVSAALTHARAYRESHPLDTMALLALARAAAANGDHVLAARAYGSLIDLFPSRAELRRAAAEGLESLGSDGLALAIDSYRKAVALRPDHASGHRLLALALWRAGQRNAAQAALDATRTSVAPWQAPVGSLDVIDNDAQLAASSISLPPMVRVCVYWENDASDVDLIVYDGAHRRIDRHQQAPGDPVVAHDVENGYGPECMTATGEQIAFPYVLQVQYSTPGPTGDAIGAVHVMQVDSGGNLRFEMRPFVLMKAGGVTELGEVAAPPSA